jgi:MoxR-like ATPase
MNVEIKKLNNKAGEYSILLKHVTDEIGKVVVGQEVIVEKLVIALISQGHVLLEGVPGLAKTLMIKTLSQTLKSNFNRIQFTPDLLPADIIGTKIYNHKDGKFSTKKGPIFTNFILADEINRAPPKVQSALLEAMQEKQVTISGDTFKITPPFFVMATQNPLETEGTYRLPEAQVDRFMFKILIDYPTAKQEMKIIDLNTTGKTFQIAEILSNADIINIQTFVQSMYCDDKIKEYVTKIVDASRRPADYKLDLNGLIEYGASPRASIWLIMAAKAHALIQGRGYVIPEDIKNVAHDVLRHRILTSYEAEAENVTSDEIIDKILEKIKVP